MKIATLVPSLSRGGAEKVAAVLSTGLTEVYDHELVVFWRREQEYETSSKIISVELQHQKNPFKRLINIFERIKKIKNVKLTHKYDVIISHLYSANMVNALSGTSKTIAVIHGAKSLSPSYVERKIAHKSYHMMDAIITVSEYYKTFFQQTFNYPAEKVFAIYNPIFVNQIIEKSNQALPKAFNFLKDKKFIVQLGSLSKPKGNWHSLRAFKEVLKQDKEVYLVFLGQAKDHYKSYLPTLAKELGIEKNVVFAGHQSNPYPFIKHATLFLMSSLREGLPMAMIESMAVGVPVLATNCISGPIEILDNSNDYVTKISNLKLAKYGALIPVCSGKEYSAKDPLSKEEEIMADAIIQLLMNKSLLEKYKSAAKERALDFDVNNCIKKYQKVIDSVVNKKTS